MHLPSLIAPERALHRPLLSIIIPALEPDAELRRCLDSIDLVLRDSPRFEVVVVTPSRFVEQTRALFPSVKVCAESRPSIYAAMNDGAVASEGSYLFFLGKDDIVLPTMQEVMRLLKEDGPSAVFCDVYWGARGLYRGVPSRWQVLGRNLCHQGIVYARSVFEKHGPYVRKMRIQADHLLNIKVLWDPTLTQPVYLAKPLVWYAGDGFSHTHRDPLFWRLYPTVMRRHVGTWAACALVLYRKLRGR